MYSYVFMDMVARGFEKFSLSRTLYSQLRDDYELSNLLMIIKLTPKVRNVGDDDYLKLYLDKSTISQRLVILLNDEIYAKPQLTH